MTFDMDQFRMIFCTCKVPGIKKDSILNYFRTGVCVLLFRSYAYRDKFEYDRGLSQLCATLTLNLSIVFYAVSARYRPATLFVVCFGLQIQTKKKDEM